MVADKVDAPRRAHNELRFMPKPLGERIERPIEPIQDRPSQHPYSPADLDEPEAKQLPGEATREDPKSSSWSACIKIALPASPSHSSAQESDDGEACFHEHCATANR